MKLLIFAAVFPYCCIFVSSSHQCNNPPGLWCASRQIARECQVELQCESFVWSQPLFDAPKVNFDLYYETLCPDCKEFVANQLSPTFTKLSEILNLGLIPYGNAREKQIGDKYEFTCQHGPMECLGNLIQTCAIDMLSNMSAIFPFVDCMEKSQLEPNTSGSQCAKQFGIDYQAILKCVSGPLGNKLEHEMAAKTNKLNPPHEYVPWVTLNGVHTDEIQQKAETDLAKLICDTYTGEWPDACKELAADGHKCLNYSN